MKITIHEAKKSESIVSDIRKNKPQVHLVGEYIDTVDYSDNFDDYDDLLDRFEGQQDFVSIKTKKGTVESPLAYDREKNLLLILDDELPADEDKEFAKELVQGFVDGKLEPVEKPLMPLMDDYVCIVDGNTYTATCYQ